MRIVKSEELGWRREIGKLYTYILDSADPRLLGALRKTVSLVGLGGMDEMHLSVFHSVSNRVCGRRSRNSISSAAYAFNSFFFFVFFVSSLCQETAFYVERVTAHRIKRNDHSCFYNHLPNSKTKLKLNHI